MSGVTALREALLGWVRVPWTEQFAQDVDELIAAVRAETLAVAGVVCVMCVERGVPAWRATDGQGFHGHVSESECWMQPCPGGHHPFQSATPPTPEAKP